MKSSPVILGVTGGIGTGKTTLCQIFNTFDIPSFSSDDCGKKLMTKDHTTITKIKCLFGDEIFTDEIPDKKKIAEKVFKQPKLLNQLNAIIHPSVKIAFDRWVTENNRHKILIKESALLFETKSHLQCNFILLIISPLSLRIRRVLARDPHRNKQDVMDIIHQQFSNEKTRKSANFIVTNDEHVSLISQANRILDSVLS